MSVLLEVEDLRVQLPGPKGLITIIDGVNLQLSRGQVHGIAGESGSGKTMTALALLRLLPPRAVVRGRVVFNGRDLIPLDRKAIGAVRGREIAMVFQDPMTSLHPMLPIGKILGDQVRHHFKVGKTEARRRAVDMLAKVRIPDPEGSLSSFPHQFSGGMRQRIAIASALICGPSLLVADEPTTALDVTVQAGIIDLLDQLRQDAGLSVLLITHDLGVMSAMADQLAVMYAGRVVESGGTAAVIHQPRHPYTAGLLAALPQPDRDERTPLLPIPGTPPSMSELPAGCAFSPRCPQVRPSCHDHVPPLIQVGDRLVACPVTAPGLSSVSAGGSR